MTQRFYLLDFLSLCFHIILIFMKAQSNHFFPSYLLEYQVTYYNFNKVTGMESFSQGGTKMLMRNLININTSKLSSPSIYLSAYHSILLPIPLSACLSIILSSHPFYDFQPFFVGGKSCLSLHCFPFFTPVNEQMRRRKK